MTITLGACFNTETSESEAGICIAPSDTSGWPAMTWCDTREEALEAKRAFQNVLLPRFTRDEAIAIVKEHRGVDAVLTVEPTTNARREYIAGVRAALEALAAAGVFVEDRGPGQAHMADLLDAAGIR